MSASISVDVDMDMQWEHPVQDCVVAQRGVLPHTDSPATRDKRGTSRSFHPATSWKG